MIEKPKTLVELFSKPNTWTKYNYARTSTNDITQVDNPAACKFCLYGALFLVYESYHSWTPEGLAAEKRIKDIIGNILLFNDNCSDQDKILELCKKAEV